MFEWIQCIMENGYVDEHGHTLHGASAISHFMNRPISAISQHEMDTGKKFVQTYLSQR